MTENQSSNDVSAETENPSEEKERFPFASGEGDEFQWYVAQAFSGYEKKVSKALKDRILNHNLIQYFADILIPEEEVTTNIRGKKRKIKKRFFPGYILIKMVMNDQTWRLVKDTDKISGFVGGNKNKPLPISTDEAAYMTNQAAVGFKVNRSSSSYSEGDSVKVTEGPFASFVGTVEAVSEKGKLKVNVSIFGRPTPVELDFSQVEKA